jgi:hypothetical protein
MNPIHEYFANKLRDELPELILSSQILTCSFRDKYEYLTDLEFRLNFGIPASVFLKARKPIIITKPMKWRRWGDVG